MLNIPSPTPVRESLRPFDSAARSHVTYALEDLQHCTEPPLLDSYCRFLWDIPTAFDIPADTRNSLAMHFWISLITGLSREDLILQGRRSRDELERVACSFIDKGFVHEPEQLLTVFCMISIPTDLDGWREMSVPSLRTLQAISVLLQRCLELRPEIEEQFIARLQDLSAQYGAGGFMVLLLAFRAQGKDETFWGRVRGYVEPQLQLDSTPAAFRESWDAIMTDSLQKYAYWLIDLQMYREAALQADHA